MPRTGKPENLKPWAPGQSGNPSGRPTKRPITERYQAVAEQLLPEDVRDALRLPKGASYGDAIALAQFRAAIKGKTEAAREIREAIEGKSTQRFEATGANGEPIAMSVEEINEKLKEFTARVRARISETEKKGKTPSENS